jgi:RNA polymerase sigma-70 factor (TIGR02960 family)
LRAGTDESGADSGSQLHMASDAHPFAWLQPCPDTVLDEAATAAAGPDARHGARESLALAFVEALQHVPPRERAVLLLRDVLGLPAAEVAEMLVADATTIMAMLDRAREALEWRLPGTDRAPPPPEGSDAEHAFVARFTDAFARGDVDGVVALLTDDAVLIVTPRGVEHRGRAAIARFLATVPAGGALERFRLVPTRANGQPAFGMYLADPMCPLARAAGLLVLTLEGDRLARMTVFRDTTVFRHFGLPRTLGAA